MLHIFTVANSISPIPGHSPPFFREGGVATNNVCAGGGQVVLVTQLHNIWRHCFQCIDDTTLECPSSCYTGDIYQMSCHFVLFQFKAVLGHPLCNEMCCIMQKYTKITF